MFFRAFCSVVFLMCFLNCFLICCLSDLFSVCSACVLFVLIDFIFLIFVLMPSCDQKLMLA